MLKDKIALVTGAARGIGESIAKRFADQGCHIVVSDIDLQGAQQVADDIESSGRSARAIKSDVSNAKEAEDLVKFTLEQFGRIDILVNNAGITRDNLLMRMNEQEWDSVIAVNLKGTYNCIKAVTRPMMKQRGGRIINLASVVGVMGNAGQANYAASKAGIIGLTKSVAKELAQRNILVNAIAPGYIETEMTKKLPATAHESFMSIIPMKRAGTPTEVANICLFLASDLANYTTGQVIHVDGGMVM
ncbi:3-oxoacyl-[acyl-carrier-protein] reductase [candidate division KSB1 bacterium]|jgi:3-oxoacyl-[acyl-carrier protein] reductase|nr:3-oxoacyl-[acyl-carrier-protein] reductase [candidate division KSB1 bacterium]